MIYYGAETKKPIVVLQLYEKEVILLDIGASLHLGKRKVRLEEN